jgi:transposase
MTDKEWQKWVKILEALLEEKDREIAFLKARIAELEKRLGLDSTNSSKPPSSDWLKKKNFTQSLRLKGKKPSGGQKGYKGSTLEQVAHPDKVIVHSLTSCPECNTNLEAVTAESTSKRQVFDIPPIRVELVRCMTRLSQSAAFNSQFPLLSS